MFGRIEGWRKIHKSNNKIGKTLRTLAFVKYIQQIFMFKHLRNFPNLQIERAMIYVEVRVFHFKSIGLFAFFCRLARFVTDCEGLLLLCSRCLCRELPAWITIKMTLELSLSLFQNNRFKGEMKKCSRCRIHIKSSEKKSPRSRKQMKSANFKLFRCKGICCAIMASGRAGDV